MYRIQQIKMPISHSDEDLKKKIIDILSVKEEKIKSFEIYRKSIDARKKDNILYIYTVDVILKDKIKLSKKNKDIIEQVQPYRYEPKVTGNIELSKPPIVIGTGPAGLFCALVLAENGYRPLIFERGKMIPDRVLDVERFWRERVLDEKSNIQFGEGGAGTFSDGKLNTLIKDRTKRGKKILEEFVKAGANSEIMYFNKPHLGTDVLRKIIIEIRKKIISLGGTFRFEEKVENIVVENGKLKAIITEKEKIDTEIAVFAIGHSARDTFEMLNKKIKLESKPFAIGLRIEHKQSMIDSYQYGKLAGNEKLGAADYKFTHRCKNGRGVYTFCMCPGGIVTGASSEKYGVVSNGMSYNSRAEENANSAVIVSVTPEDFGNEDPLAGVEFQRKYEKLAYIAGGENYNAPVQLFGDFEKNNISKEFGNVKPSYLPGTTFANLREILPKYISESIIEGINAFSKHLEGFNHKDAILTGVETRTSSPVRIVRNELGEATVEGVYPTGEGAGYAGGIMSAAIDGLKTAEAIMSKYKPIK